MKNFLFLYIQRFIVYCLLKQSSGRRRWHPTPVLLPGKSHGRRSLEGCSPWGRWGADTTERLHFHFSLSRIGEGNGNPLQCSCLESPRDGGAWWAAIYGVTQSQTRLKRLSSSSSSIHISTLFRCFSQKIISVLRRVSCAMKQVLISYILYISWCVCVNPSFPIYPSPPLSSP